MQLADRVANRLALARNRYLIEIRSGLNSSVRLRHLGRYCLPCGRGNRYLIVT